MIPADVANTLRLLTPDLKSATQAQAQTQPVVAAQRITDALSNLVPGQRLLAEIQALLPNGTYRAVVAQRELTLALPFSAKAGDSVELEVVESDGRVALAVVAKQGGRQGGNAADASVPTTLSNTGKMIGELLAGIDDQGKRAAPAPLNGNRPLAESFSGKASELAPVLKEALSKSGVFYEAHQARWIAGELPTASLLQEPQGKHSSPSATQNAAANTAIPPPSAPAEKEANSSQPATTATITTATTNHQELPSSSARNASKGNAALQNMSAPLASRIPGDLTPIIQQQLDALATQTFAWQGQVWPGQQMHWEIDDQGERSAGNDEHTANRWRTRLKLDLPRIGSIAASLVLHPGNEVGIEISTPDNNTRETLTAAAKLLQQQFASAGLKLTGLSVRHEQADQ